MEEKTQYLDFCRCIATISVICLHVSAKFWGRFPVESTTWAVANGFDSAVRCCVPLFFMISGALFCRAEKALDYGVFLRKNVLKILVAYGFWSTFYAIFAYVQGRFQGDVWAWVWRVINGNYHLWFLHSLLWIYLALPVFRSIARDKLASEVYVGLFFFLCCGGNFIQLVPSWAVRWEYLASLGNFEFFLGYGGYFLWGHILHSYGENQRKYRKIWYGVAVIALGITLFGTEILSRASGTAQSGLYQYCLPTTFSVATAVFLWCQQGKFGGKSRGILGQISPFLFGIYLVHDFFLVVLLENYGWLYWDIPTALAIPFFVGIVFLASLGVVAVVKICKPLARWIV